MKRATLKGTVTLDTSVLLELLAGTSAGNFILTALTENAISAHTSTVNLVEAEYVLCRRLGADNVSAKIDALEKSNYISIQEGPTLRRAAARIKCRRSIALPDCYTIALAENLGAQALFRLREAELVKELRRKPFEADILFLEDYTAMK